MLYVFVNKDKHYLNIYNCILKILWSFFIFYVYLKTAFDVICVEMNFKIGRKIYIELNLQFKELGH